jgi:hypothetical protein
MKQFIMALPFVLLCALVPFFFYTSPNIAQSIIVLSISALCGYNCYLITQESPDYRKLFERELHAIRQENKELKESYGKLTLNDMKKKEERSFVF